MLLNIFSDNARNSSTCSCGIPLQSSLKISQSISRSIFMNMKMLPMTDGCYAVFFPEDVHRPCCMMDTPEDVKKIVLKVRVDSL